MVDRLNGTAPLPSAAPSGRGDIGFVGVPHGVEMRNGAMDPRLRAVTDVSPADWVADGIGSFASGVAGLVPPRFAAYARILHPARSRDERPVRWAEVAAWAGRTVHPLAQFHAISRPHQGAGRGPAPWDEEPSPGHLEPSLLAALCDTLARHTGATDRCWFCLWEGFGWIHGSPAVAIMGSPGPVPPAFPPEVINGPRVRLPGRDYLLFSGPLEAAAGMGWQVSADWFDPQSPNLFWPDERAWLVATEIDLDSTYVGGSADLVDALLADERLEAWRARPTDPISDDSDRLNREP